MFKFAHDDCVFNLTVDKHRARKEKELKGPIHYSGETEGVGRRRQIPWTPGLGVIGIVPLNFSTTHVQNYLSMFKVIGKKQKIKPGYS